MERRRKPNMFLYRLTQVICWFVAVFVFRRKIVRNEIRGKKGPFVIIANHQAQLDFVNLIGITSTPMSFVISDSFYNTLPVKGILTRLDVIPKQQFQTTVSDLKRMKHAIEDGKVLVIYPAGLMCEDGLSTPIPAATYQFLKWIRADIYMARTDGTYFAMPKWARGMRPGRTYLDVYRLFSGEEIARMDVEEVRNRAEGALLFDAYREQERLRIKYYDNDNLEGLENVLYMCPNCGAEFTVRVRDRKVIYCESCGYEQVSDKYAFLHNQSGVGREVRYVSDWSRWIYDELKVRVREGKETELSASTAIHMIDRKRHRFVEVGRGQLRLTESGFVLCGSVKGEETELNIPIACFASLPFRPGMYLEIQHGENIYRCLLDDGHLVMKFINMVKIYYELSSAVRERC